MLLGMAPRQHSFKSQRPANRFRSWPVEVTEVDGKKRYDLSAVINLLGSPEKTLVSFQLVGDNNWRTPVATVELQRQSAADSIECMPGIFVVSLGRSGSTMLMSALSAHKQVVAYERHPLETRISQQYARIAKTLTEPADFFDPELEAFAHTSKVASNAYLRPGWRHH